MLTVLDNIVHALLRKVTYLNELSTILSKEFVGLGNVSYGENITSEHTERLAELEEVCRIIRVQSINLFTTFLLSGAENARGMMSEK